MPPRPGPPAPSDPGPSDGDEPGTPDTTPGISVNPVDAGIAGMSTTRGAADSVIDNCAGRGAGAVTRSRPRDSARRGGSGFLFPPPPPPPPGPPGGIQTTLPSGALRWSGIGSGMWDMTKRTITKTATWVMADTPIALLNERRT